MATNIPELEPSNTVDTQNVEKDIDLDALLNDALGDFNKPIFMPPKESPKSNLENSSGDDAMLLENIWNEPSMKEAMSYFEDSIRSVFSSSGFKANQDTDISKKSFGDGNKNQEEHGAENLGLGNCEPVDIDSLISDFQKMAKMTAETFKNECGFEMPDMKGEDDLFAEEFSKSFMEVAQTLSSSKLKEDESTMKTFDEDDNVFHTMVKQTISNLSENSKDLKDCKKITDCSEELNKLLKDIENDDNLNNNLLKFMKICMKTMKSVVYPSLKELCDKFPQYLEDSKSKLSESEYANHEKQYQIMAKVCNLFETEDLESSTGTVEHSDPGKESDETEKMYKKFITILNVMKESQDYGQIPDELSQNQTKFFEDVVLGLVSNEKDNASCSIL